MLKETMLIPGLMRYEAIRALQAAAGGGGGGAAGILTDGHAKSTPPPPPPPHVPPPAPQPRPPKTTKRTNCSPARDRALAISSDRSNTIVMRLAGPLSRLVYCVDRWLCVCVCVCVQRARWRAV